MFTLNCKGRLIVAETPMVMGIINLTPDSFYPGSRASDPDDIIGRAAAMIAEGAHIIDIGAQSTRPQSARLSAREELDRLGDIFRRLSVQFPETIFSIDTFHGAVAREAVWQGASMINDISGGSMDAEMLSIAGTLTVPFVCTHMKGTPQTMMQQSAYNDVSAEVLDYFIGKLEACREAGIHDVIVDPGFGFSKNQGHNFELLRKLSVLKILGRPILAGLSRKSSIYKTLGIPASEALNGTTVLHTIALLNGADILRVHDVKEAREVITLIAAYRGSV